MTKEEQPTITQSDRDAAADMWTMLGKVQFVHWQADWMRDGTADHGPVVQAFARHRIAEQSASCDLGVGCDEAGVCYANANGKPEMCHRTTSLAAQDGLVDEILAHVERICGPISTEVCEVAGDDDRSVLRHNIGAVLWVSAIKGDKS